MSFQDQQDIEFDVLIFCLHIRDIHYEKRKLRQAVEVAKGKSRMLHRPFVFGFMMARSRGCHVPMADLGYADEAAIIGDADDLDHNPRVKSTVNRVKSMLIIHALPMMLL